MGPHGLRRPGFCWAAFALSVGCGGTADGPTNKDAADVTLAAGPTTETASAERTSIPRQAPSEDSDRRDVARFNGQVVWNAAELRMAQRPDGTCPTVSDLVDAKLMAPKHTTDPWGAPYVIVCDEGDVEVWSAGPDGQIRTRDDISSEELSKD